VYQALRLLPWSYSESTECAYLDGARREKGVAEPSATWKGRSSHGEPFSYTVRGEAVLARDILK